MFWAWSHVSFRFPLIVGGDTLLGWSRPFREQHAMRVKPMACLSDGVDRLQSVHTHNVLGTGFRVLTTEPSPVLEERERKRGEDGILQE